MSNQSKKAFQTETWCHSCILKARALWVKVRHGHSCNDIASQHPEPLLQKGPLWQTCLSSLPLPFPHIPFFTLSSSYAFSSSMFLSSRPSSWHSTDLTPVDNEDDAWSALAGQNQSPRSQIIWLDRHCHWTEYWNRHTNNQVKKQKLDRQIGRLVGVNCYH